jgi:hypothetical protein
MIIVIDKKSRDLLGVADTLAEAKALRNGRMDSTQTCIVGQAAYQTRYMRNS